MYLHMYRSVVSSKNGYHVLFFWIYIICIVKYCVQKMQRFLDYLFICMYIRSSN